MRPAGLCFFLITEFGVELHFGYQPHCEVSIYRILPHIWEKFLPVNYSGSGLSVRGPNFIGSSI
jgi:hypothetical protein